MSERAGRSRTLLIVAAGVAVQLFLIAIAHCPEPRPLQGDEKMYHARALRVAAGDFPEPDFAWPPLQTCLVGGLYALFGPHRLPVELLQGGLLLGSGLLLRRLVLGAGLGAPAADTALAFLLLDPQLAAFAQYLWPEVIHVFFGLLCLALLVLGDRGAAGCFGSGVAFGLAQLSKLFLKPFVPFLVLLAAIRPAGARPVDRIRRMVGFAGGAAVVLVPVVLFHGIRYRVWTIADTSAHVIWMGLNSVRDTATFELFSTPAYYEYEGSSKDPAERNRLEWIKIRRKLESDGLVRVLEHQISTQYFRLLDKRSFFVDQLPGERWAPPGRPVTAFSSALKGWAYGAWALLLAAASFGICQLERRDLTGPVLIPALYLGISLGLFFILNARSRYRLPLIPAFAFFAALAVDRVGNRPGQRGRGVRIGAGAILATLFLFLAFSEPA